MSEIINPLEKLVRVDANTTLINNVETSEWYEVYSTVPPSTEETLVDIFTTEQDAWDYVDTNTDPEIVYIVYYVQFNGLLRTRLERV